MVARRTAWAASILAIRCSRGGYVQSRECPVISEKVIVVVLVRREDEGLLAVASWMQLACFDCKNGKVQSLAYAW